MHSQIRKAAIAAGLLLGFTGSASAQFIYSATWQTDNIADGKGTGTVPNTRPLLPPVTLNYFTAPVGNAGTTITDFWKLSQATNDITTYGMIVNSAGILGASAVLSPALQTVTFSSYVDSIIILVNYADPTAIMDFGFRTVTLLDSHNAQLNGHVVSFVGATGSFDDGFAARIGPLINTNPPGHFDPDNPLQFTYSTSDPEDTVAFTIATSPESGSLWLLLAGALPVAAAILRGRKDPHKRA